MADWLVRREFRCPRCDYDVRDQLERGVSLCPECGGEVTAETCVGGDTSVPAAARRWIYASWWAPLVGVGLGFGPAAVFHEPWFALAGGAAGTAAVYAG